MTTTPPPKTMSLLAQEFNTNGFLGPISIISCQEALEVWNEIQNEWSDNNNNTNDDDDDDDDGGGGDVRFKLHLFLPKVAALVRHSNLLNIIVHELGISIPVLWSSDVNIKQPNSNAIYCPHQDSTYAGLQPISDCITVWIALTDPVGEKEGCMSFYPQSHKLGQVEHVEEDKKEEKDDDDDNGIDEMDSEHIAIFSSSTITKKSSSKSVTNLLSRGQYIPNVTKLLQSNKLPSTTPKSIPLRGGQATIHYFGTIHQSGPNQSLHQPRVGLALRIFNGQTVTQQNTMAREMVTLLPILNENNNDNNNLTTTTTTLSSVVVAKNFDLEPLLPLPNPTVNDMEHGRKVHAIAMERERANYFANSEGSQRYK